MKLRLASLMLVSCIAHSQEYTIEKHEPYGAYQKETYTIKEKKKVGKLTPHEAFKNNIPFTHVLVTDSKYATLVERIDGSCVDNRNAIIRALRDKLDPNIDELDKMEYLAYVRMDCVILKSNMNPLTMNGYARELAFHINEQDELRILDYPGWWKCNRLSTRWVNLGQFFTCKETKQLYN